jgi:Leucine-rich repeat (LRR) protein
VVFVFSSTVSWTRVITWYSLYKSDYINRAYISSLSYQSLPYLVDLNLHPEKFSQREMNESFESDNDIVQLYDQLMNRDWGNKNEFSLRLYRKVYSQLVSCRRTNWRSSNYNVNRVEKELLAFPKFGDDHVLQLDYSDIDELAYFTGFSGIERIDAGNNSITSIGELGKYPMLEEVSLENNELTSLNGIERCNKLTYLNVEGNNITDFSPLIKVITLKRIDVSNLNESGIAALRAARPDIIIE